MLAILSKNFSHNLFFVILSLTNEPSKTGHVTRGPPVCVVLHVLVAEELGFLSPLVGSYCKSTSSGYQVLFLTLGFCKLSTSCGTFFRTSPNDFGG